MSPEPSENHVSLSNLLRHKTLPRLLNSSVDVSLAATHGKEAVPGSNPFHGKPSKFVQVSAVRTLPGAFEINHA